MERYRRYPKLDRPELILPSGNRKIPQSIGFITSGGTELQMSPSHAEALGLIAHGAVKTVSMTTEKYKRLLKKWEEWKD